ncbi:MAG: hypothetical protein IT440_00460 [Phycisphaeraceae bacterium]|nr:hypothetical protein [Phycisphaeraceae bacterium]
MDTPQQLPFQFGFRGKLYALLVEKGYAVQFVGVASNGTDGTRIVAGHTPTPDLRALGQDKHCGFAGRGTVYLLENIENWVTTYKPDVVLLMVGINDIWKLPNARIVENLTAIMEKIVTLSPTTDVIVAQTTPMSCGPQLLADYNILIRDTVVPSFVAKGKRVSIVDQYSFFIKDGKIDVSLFSNGQNHPSASAYDHMAEIWAKGIEAVRPIQGTKK